MVTQGEKRKIYSMGAGPWQVAGIKRARELGLHVIAVDGDDNAPGLEHAHAREPSALDPNIPTVSFATDFQAGTLPKSLQKDYFKRLGLLHPVTWAHGPGPWVVKPDTGSGSRGVMVIPSSVPSDTFQLVEQYIAGTEYAVESFAIQGEVFPQLVLRKCKVTDTVANILVTEVDKALSDKIALTAIAMVRACKQKNGPGHSEIILSKDNGNCYALETHPRGGGFHLWQTLVQLSTTFRSMDWTIKSAMGHHPWVSDVPTKRYEVGVRYFTKDELLPLRLHKSAVINGKLCSLTWETFDWYSSENRSTLLTDSDRKGCVIVQAPVGTELEPFLRNI